MRKFFSLGAILLVCALIFAGCGNAPTATNAPRAVTTPSVTPGTQTIPASISPKPAAEVWAPVVGPADPSAKTGGILKVGVPTDAVGLGQPQMGKVMWDSILAAPALETLAVMDTSGKPAPWLAQSWTQDYNTMTVTIKLRQGVQFSDGTAFDATAVQWNLQLCMANKVSSVAQIKSVDIVDNNTVKCNLSTWVPDIATNMLTTFMVSPAAWTKNGNDWGKQNPVGTGPFTLASHERETSIKYVKNTNYWQKGKPYLNEFYFMVIAEATTRLLSFQAGEVDEILDPTIAQVQDLSKNSKYVIGRLKNGLNSYVLAPSADDPAAPLSNIKVRQAVAYAIDRQALVDGILGGYGAVSTQQWPTGTWPNNPNLPGYASDPSKAKQLLSEAGYPNGIPTPIKLIASSAIANEGLVATALQGMLSKIGIQATLDLQALAQMDATKRGGHAGILLCNQAPSPALVDFTITTSMKSTGRLFYPTILKTPAIDNAINTAMSSVDMSTFQTNIWALDNIVFYQDVQFIPLYWGDGLLVKYPYVMNDYIYSNSTTKHSGLQDAWLNK